MTRQWETECWEPRCRRQDGHDGEHRPRRLSAELCGAWMPLAQEQCARFAGHETEHRTAAAVENNRNAARARREVPA